MDNYNLSMSCSCNDFHLRMCNIFLYICKYLRVSSNINSGTRLDLSEEEAILYLQNLLDMSVTAVMAVLVEHFHKFAQYWRK